MSVWQTGGATQFTAVVRDITERKRAEAELNHLNDEIQLQRLRVFKATMRTVQDIVNNLLNGLQLVHIEAEGQLPDEMQTLIDRVIQEAAVKLKGLFRRAWCAPGRITLLVKDGKVCPQPEYVRAVNRKIAASRDIETHACRHSSPIDSLNDVERLWPAYC